MTDLILGEEKSRILKQISVQYLSIIFDGTCRLGEVLAVVVRFIMRIGKLFNT